jgi:ubiquinone/menaquinone biosynthesis C-methylase UbiE
MHLLRCPISWAPLHHSGAGFSSEDGAHVYLLSPTGIPQFATEVISEDAAVQREHYDRIAAAYVANLGYPHTQEYMRYLDDAMRCIIPSGSLGTVAEICCGRGEAFEMIGDRVETGIGVDISPAMLEEAARLHAANPRLRFVQGDATNLPLQDASFDTVFMFGGIHHVNDRQALFSEIARILKPGGTFFYREPVSDFFMWKLLRAIIYRASPTLDHETERPLLHHETVPLLEQAGLASTHWSTHGFLGFCLLMNSDVLIFNRLFRFVPGIKTVTRAFTQLDKLTLKLPGMSRAGLQVVGAARKKDA